MHRTLTTLFFILLFPILVFAQDDNVVKDFAKRAVDLQSVQVNEHLNVLQITYDDDVFELVGMNDQMQTIWRSTFKGHPYQTAKFKGNVVTIASSEFSLSKGPSNTYNAFFIDISNGKVITQNQIATSEDTHQHFPQLFTGDGNFCKVIIRQNDLKYGAFSIGLINWNKNIKAYNATTDLQELELNDKLEVVNSFKPEIDAGLYIGSAVNNKGNIFISWLNSNSVEVYKYGNEKDAPSKKLSSDIPIGTIELNTDDEHHVTALVADEKDENKVYYAVIYKNKNKNPELNVGRFDFTNGKESSTTEEFIKKERKRLEKSYVGVNKKINDPEFSSDQMEFKYVNEVNGKLIIALATYYLVTYNSATLTIDDAILINGYDLDLNQKFQQLMPVKSSNPFTKLYNGFNIANDKLNILSNYTSGSFNSHGQALGTLDLNTGEWDKMDILSKKHVNNSDFADGKGVMWFGNSYIVPYCNPKSMVSYVRAEITLQQNQY
ncbi:hypothetical protein [Mucilaginibacter sp.]